MHPKHHTADRVIARVGRRQHNLVTRRQLLAAGVTAEEIKTRVRRGSLWPVQRTVYSVGTDRLTPQGHWLAAVLACGDGAVLSHRSAAALWGIGPTIVLPVHVIVPRQKQRRPGLVPHRHRLAPGDTTARNGIPVTTVPRTIADLPRHQRDAAAIKASVLGLADDGGPRYRSVLEADVHRMIGELGLAPGVNAVVEGRERDLVFPEQKVVIEIDGPHHDHPAQHAQDRARDDELRRAGWRTRRLKAR